MSQADNGASWSEDVAVAERFAIERRMMEGGGVLIETFAATEATICAVDYPPPFSAEEVALMSLEYPNIAIDDFQFHEEREYVVDRRFLSA